jgi:hypothetical protein
LSTAGPVESRGKRGGPPSKAKYSWRPIVDQYREGTVKSPPGGECKEPETVRLQAVRGRKPDRVLIEE